MQCRGGAVSERTDCGFFFVVDSSATALFSSAMRRGSRSDATDVRFAPTFDHVWQNALQDFIGDSILVAHNAPFDAGVLRGTLQFYGISAPQNEWACSCRKARAYFRKEILHPLPNYQLHTVAEYFGIQFHHHDALEDALAAAQIMLEMTRR